MPVGEAGGPDLVWLMSPTAGAVRSDVAGEGKPRTESITFCERHICWAAVGAPCINATMASSSMEDRPISSSECTDSRDAVLPRMTAAAALLVGARVMAGRADVTRGCLARALPVARDAMAAEAARVPGFSSVMPLVA